MNEVEFRIFLLSALIDIFRELDKRVLSGLDFQTAVKTLIFDADWIEGFVMAHRDQKCKEVFDEIFNSFKKQGNFS